MKKTIFSILLVSLSLWGDEINYNRELEDHLIRISQKVFAKYQENVDTSETSGEWKIPIENALVKLTAGSGYPDFPIKYTIVKDEDFQAGTLPGGQIVIYSGTLGILDGYIDKLLQNPEKNPHPKDYYRERYIAGILSHELTHFYQKHSLNNVKKIPLSLTPDKTIQSFETIKFSQEAEKDADFGGYRLLMRAGYDPKYVVVILEIINDIVQAADGHPAGPYFNSHPSPHARLQHFQSERQEFHRWAAKMENTFADIYMGTKLDEAHRELTQAIRQYPNNAELLKAKAICKHKMWLKSAKLKDLKLRSIVDISAFADKMVYSDTSSMAGERIPGNSALYYQAIDEYEEAYKLAQNDVQLMSNYATLLAYTGSNHEKAVSLAESANSEGGNLITKNNLGVVYYLTGDEEKAKAHFSDISGTMSTVILFTLILKPELAEQMSQLKLQAQRIQNYDKSFVPEFYTIFLNNAILNKDDRGIVENYLNDYDSTSSWAVYLGRTSGVAMPAPENPINHASVNGIKVGDTMESLLNQWGKPSRVETGVNLEAWFYDKISATVFVGNGVVLQMLISADSAKVNNILGISSNKSAVEKQFGSRSKKRGEYFVYPAKSGSVVVKYDNANKVKEIALVPKL